MKRTAIVAIYVTLLAHAWCYSQTRGESGTYPETTQAPTERSRRTSDLTPDCIQDSRSENCQEDEQTPSVRIHMDSTQDQDNPANVRRAGAYNDAHGQRQTDGAPDRATFEPKRPQSEEETEFQSFVEESAGKRLPVFGYNLFRDVPTTFAPLDRVPVPASYVIGPGDQLLIRAWGQIDIDARVIVDRNGQIYLPQIGAITIAGTTYDDLQTRLTSEIGRLFRNFKLTVSLGQLRSIQIFVVGYARRPGTYTVSSLSTLVNALFASGGPSNRGSLRHIQVKREGKVVTDFDFYDLLLRGDKSKDVMLQSGDVIYVPPVGPQVALTGSVTLPGIYELHSTSTLREQLDIAGGLTTVADGQRVIVERIDGRSTRKVEEFGLDSQGMTRELRDGDLVHVFAISPKFDNAVTIRGNVAEPGRYPFRPGMKVRDLIPNREFLLTRAFWTQRNSRSVLTKGDRIEPDAGDSGRASGDDLDDGRPVRLKVRRDDSANRIVGQAELRNDVRLSAPEINWDYAVVQRINQVDLSTSLIAFDLGKAILGGDEGENIALQAGDVITIFSQYDIAVSLEHRSKIVRLEGEVRAPGVYKLAPGETLRALITRAGGLTDGAYLFGTQLTRESARKQQQASLEQMTREVELEAQHQSLFAAKARPDQAQGIQAQLESQRALIDKLRQIHATGRVVLEIEPTQFDVDALPNVQLEDGDRIAIPHRPSMVSVVGAVYNQNSFLYHKNASVSDYLKRAGSGNRDADMKHVFVIRADGSVLSRKSVSSVWSGGVEKLRVIPGDTVVVPAQLDKGNGMRAFKDWSQVFSQLVLGAAAVNVLK